jgi:hypothetical protein
MGFHFGTCLSPQNTNFFSTIANAIDVNKQVVYGKTPSGRVIGRCLFALADNGTILTYHRYAHNPRDHFEQEVVRFAEDLADEMKTVISPRGKAATLVAKDWYDDGVVACGSICDIHAGDGAVRTALRDAAPAKLLESLGACFGSEELFKGMLGEVLFADEFRECPALVKPLLARFAFDSSVELPARLRLAVLAQRAGEEAVAEQIVRDLRVNTLPQRLKRFSDPYSGEFYSIGSYDEVFGLLVACNPSIALRTLRATRPRDVKSDTEEKSRVRRKQLAKCFEALGREAADLKEADPSSR